MAMATHDVPPFGDDLREYEPDREGRARHYAKLRVLDECDRRIRTRYPLDRQLQIVAARQGLGLTRLSGDARRMVENDASAFTVFVEFVALHRLAAQALCEWIDQGKICPREVDITSDAFWKVSVNEQSSREAGHDEAG